MEKNMSYITWTGAGTSVSSVTGVTFEIFFDI